jgi:multiple antibiotic resistance protein
VISIGQHYIRLTISEMSFLARAFLTLLVVIDPVGLVSIFTSLADKYTPTQQERTARQAVLVAGSILLVFALISNLMLRYLGISIEAFQISGCSLVLQ